VVRAHHVLQAFQPRPVAVYASSVRTGLKWVRTVRVKHALPVSRHITSRVLICAHRVLHYIQVVHRLHYSRLNQEVCVIYALQARLFRERRVRRVQPVKRLRRVVRVRHVQPVKRLRQVVRVRHVQPVKRRRWVVRVRHVQPVKRRRWVVRVRRVRLDKYPMERVGRVHPVQQGSGQMPYRECVQTVPRGKFLIAQQTRVKTVQPTRIPSHTMVDQYVNLANTDGQQTVKQAHRRVHRVPRGIRTKIMDRV
jgi:hypothetical protein